MFIYGVMLTAAVTQVVLLLLLLAKFSYEKDLHLFVLPLVIGVFLTGMTLHLYLNANP